MNKTFWFVAVLVTVVLGVLVFTMPVTWFVFAGYGLAIGLAFTLLHSRGRRHLRRQS